MKLQRIDKQGRGWVKVGAKIARLIAGEDDLSDWSDEELLNGRPADQNGAFSGQPPTLIPREVYIEWIRRQMDRGFQDMLGDLREVVAAVRELVTEPDTDDSVKLRAASMIMDRVYGKPREAVDVSFGDNREQWERIVDEVTIDRSLDDGNVIDAEVLDDDDDWQDDPEFAEDEELRDGGQWADDRRDEWDDVA